MSRSLKSVADGSLLANAGPLSTTCCGGNGNCTPYVLDSEITDGNTNPVWDLRPYQGPGIATGDCWRLCEMAFAITYEYGCITDDGELDEMPDEFVTGYLYEGAMEIQIGCYVEGGAILWP